jgi:ubiquitin carboxyl-terminal hydrolase L5
MSDDPSGWSLTESDPQVFTQLLRDLGVKGLQVVRFVPASTSLRVVTFCLSKLIGQDDLYSLDASTLETLKPIHALIFLFKHVGYGDGSGSSGVEVDPLESGVWFANQVGGQRLESRQWSELMQIFRSLIIAAVHWLL